MALPLSCVTSTKPPHDLTPEVGGVDNPFPVPPGADGTVAIGEFPRLLPSPWLLLSPPLSGGLSSTLVAGKMSGLCSKISDTKSSFGARGKSTV